MNRQTKANYIYKPQLTTWHCNTRCKMFSEYDQKKTLKN